MMENPIFRQNVIIITGASMGIGRELAFQFAKQGAWMALAARNAEKLEEVSQQCRQRGGRSISIPTDVAYQAQCQYRRWPGRVWAVSCEGKGGHRAKGRASDS